MVQRWNRPTRCSSVLAGCIAAAGACGDPTIDSVIDGLGPEQRGVPQGPTHRPGQPCVTCHQGAGPGEPSFSLGGTVYQDDAQLLPLQGASVELADAEGRVFSTLTNCAGNFYVEADDWQPTFPVWVQVRLGDLVTDMETPIYRERSCATCHAAVPSPELTLPVYLSEDPLGLPVEDCR